MLPPSAKGGEVGGARLASDPLRGGSGVRMDGVKGRVGCAGRRGMIVARGGGPGGSRRRRSKRRDGTPTGQA